MFAHGKDADPTSAAFDLPADAVENASFDGPISERCHRSWRGGPIIEWTRRGRRPGAGALVALLAAVAAGVPANAEKPRVTMTARTWASYPAWSRPVRPTPGATWRAMTQSRTSP